MEPRLPTDDVTNDYFDHVAFRLRDTFGYTAEQSNSMIHEYYTLAKNPEYCAKVRLPIWSDEDFQHEGDLNVALRIHFHLVLKPEKRDHASFIIWRKEFLQRRDAQRKALIDRRNAGGGPD